MSKRPSAAQRRPGAAPSQPRGNRRGAERYDVVIVGAGAAGRMCAAEAGKRGRRALVLEHADRVGKKILISGAAGATSPTGGPFPKTISLETPSSASPP